MIESLIHLTQMGFVNGRSILDNIFTFWKVVSLAHWREDPLAILLLDFEKVYGHVDWAFLKDNMAFP